jgi:hypothetical protein
MSNFCNFDWSAYTGPPWYRATLSCTGNNFSQYDLNMRRKAEILKYNKNQNNPTKKQLWSMLNNGTLTRKKGWATQGIVTSNPNTNNLNLVGNTLVCNSNTANPLILVNPTSSSNVPGKQIGLYLNPSVPLTNYKPQITYSITGNTYYPGNSWMPWRQ